MVEPGRPTDDNKIRRMSFACSMTKATDTHSEYVICITFLRQRWLQCYVIPKLHVLLTFLSCEINPVGQDPCFEKLIVVVTQECSGHVIESHAAIPF